MPQQAVRIDAIPDALKARPQWVTWRYHTRKGDDKPTKVPFNARTGEFASSKNAADWSDFNTALRAYQHSSSKFGQGYDGIGFVFSDDDNLVGIDLDDCLIDGRLAPWAKEIIEQLPSYAEISPSGKGVKIFVEGSIPNSVKLDEYHSGAIEIYNSGRYFTVTGQRIDAAPQTIQYVNGALTKLHEDVTQERERRRRKAYLDRALDDELNLLKSKKEGGRNNQLYDSTRALMRFVQSGDITEHDAREWLSDAAQECGLSAHEARQCIDSAFRGTVNPFQMPAPQAPTSASKPQQQEEKKPVRRWLSEDEIEELQPPTWLIKDTIPAGEVTVIFGPSDAGKTFVVVDMAMRVAQHYPVMYIAAEDGPGVKIRKKAWQYHYKRQSNGNFRMWNDVLPLYDTAEVDNFITQVACTNSRLIVIDTLSQCSDGVDENNAKEMGPVLRNCNRIAKACSAAVVVIHHTTKNGTEYRGSGTIKANTYGFWRVENNDGEIIFDKIRVKNTASIPARRFRLMSVGDSAVIQPAKKIRQGDKLTPSQYKLLLAIGEISKAMGEASSKEIQEHADLRGGNFYRPLSFLMNRGFIGKGDKKTSGFYLTQSGRDYLTHEYTIEAAGNEYQEGDDAVFEINTSLDGGTSVEAVGTCVVDRGRSVDTTTGEVMEPHYSAVETTYRDADGYAGGVVDRVVDTVGTSDGRYVVDSRGGGVAMPENSGRSGGTSAVDQSTYHTPSLKDGVVVDDRLEDRKVESRRPLNWQYLTNSYAQQNYGAINTHCALHGAKVDEVLQVLEQEAGIFLPDDFENETL